MADDRWTTPKTQNQRDNEKRVQDLLRPKLPDSMERLPGAPPEEYGARHAEAERTMPRGPGAGQAVDSFYNQFADLPLPKSGWGGGDPGLPGLEEAALIEALGQNPDSAGAGFVPTEGQPGGSFRPTRTSDIQLKGNGPMGQRETPEPTGSGMGRGFPGMRYDMDRLFGRDPGALPPKVNERGPYPQGPGGMALGGGMGTGVATMYPAGKEPGMDLPLPASPQGAPARPGAPSMPTPMGSTDDYTPSMRPPRSVTKPARPAAGGGEQVWQTYEKATGKKWGGGGSADVQQLLQQLQIGGKAGSAEQNLALQKALRNPEVMNALRLKMLAAANPGVSGVEEDPDAPPMVGRGRHAPGDRIVPDVTGLRR